MVIKLALVDDKPIVRKAIRDKLSAFENIQIISESSDGEDFLKTLKLLAHKDLPNIVLVDLEMPNMIEVLGDRKLTHSIFRNQIKLGGKDQPTPEQEKLVARLNTVVGEAAQLAFDAGFAQIHRQLGVERGAAMPVADAEAGKQLGAIFGAYLIDEVEAAVEQAQHVAMQSDSPAP